MVPLNFRPIYHFLKIRNGSATAWYDVDVWLLMFALNGVVGTSCQTPEFWVVWHSTHIIGIGWNAAWACFVSSGTVQHSAVCNEWFLSSMLLYFFKMHAMLKDAAWWAWTWLANGIMRHCSLSIVLHEHRRYVDITDLDVKNIVSAFMERILSTYNTIRVHNRHTHSSWQNLKLMLKKYAQRAKTFPMCHFWPQETWLIGMLNSGSTRKQSFKW